MKKTSLTAISFITLLGLAIFGAYLAFGTSDADAREGPKNFVVAIQGYADGEDRVIDGIDNI